MAAVLWLIMSLEWRSGGRIQCRRGSTMSRSSSYTQPPSSPASMGSPATTAQTHLPYCQYWKLCRRYISRINDLEQDLSAPLDIVFRAWETHMLLRYSVSCIWDRKFYMDQGVDGIYQSWLGNSCMLWLLVTRTATAWAAWAMLPVLHIQGGLQAVLCCTNPWSQDNFSQITVSDATGSSLRYQQLYCLLSFPFMEKYSEKLSCKSSLWIVWFPIKEIIH